ncbi:hypothetical protein K438DRAFT_1872870 [Mycena galopus ATCC 62051]|nr:hypothetical protein K438DRAFT_1872870 [Mycena galopus ATCC 62051]
MKTLFGSILAYLMIQRLLVPSESRWAARGPPWDLLRQLGVRQYGERALTLGFSPAESRSAMQPPSTVVCLRPCRRRFFPPFSRSVAAHFSLIDRGVRVGRVLGTP